MMFLNILFLMKVVVVFMYGMCVWNMIFLGKRYTVMIFCYRNGGIVVKKEIYY